MLKIKVEDREYKIPNFFSEITMVQLDELSLLLNQKKSNIECWCDVISYLGDIPIDYIQNWDIDDFSVVVNYLFSQPDKTSKRMWFKIAGRTFSNTKEKLSTIESINIEKTLDKNKDLQLTRIFAILFTEKEKTNIENYSESAIAERVELFKNVKASIAVPHLAKFGIKFVESYENTLKQMENK